MHDVRHKSNGRELIRKMPPEKPKGGIRGIDLLAEFKEEGGGDIFFLDGNEHFHAQAGNVFLLGLNTP